MGWRPSGRWRSLTPLATVAIVLLAMVLGLACGDRDRVPSSGVKTPSGGANGRITVTLAVRDDPGHRLFFYAVEQGIVSSDRIDLDIAYRSVSELDEALVAKQYDVVEAAPVALPAMQEEGIDLVLLSGGVQNRQGTLIFVEAESEAQDIAALVGRVLAYAPQGGDFETRLLLEQVYGLRLVGGSEEDAVGIEEVPAEALRGLLEDGEVDAVVATQSFAYRLLQDARVRAIANPAREVQTSLGQPLLDSVLLTYPDVAAAKDEALAELRALLAASVSYLQTNRDQVVEAVSREQTISEGLLRWWLEAYRPVFGELSSDVQQQVVNMWEAARILGDLDTYPDLAAVSFGAEATPAATPTPEGTADDGA